MKNSDEEELHRLCDLLKEVDELLDSDSPLREAVRQGALALTLVFSQGSRAILEDMARGIGKPLDEAQRTELRTRGIEP